MPVNSLPESIPLITIYQGRANSPYFHIILPVPGIALQKNQPICCVNPKTKSLLNGIVTEHYWIIDWEEPPVGFLLGIWGVDPQLLRKVLLLSDPGFSDSWARVILIKETA